MDAEAGGAVEMTDDFLCFGLAKADAGVEAIFGVKDQVGVAGHVSGPPPWRWRRGRLLWHALPCHRQRSRHPTYPLRRSIRAAPPANPAQRRSGGRWPRFALRTRRRW